ncbi:MAG: Gfo/Idh/MocA family oxidoreductase [Trueperaceae bacterium]|nr:Gfo/Idh/MocA family oxidoreductase [Trueperaceae bacterium]
MKRLKVAVIGIGVMGRHHANIYAALPHVDLVAVVEPDDFRRFEAEAQFDVRAYATIDELLKHEKLDAVSIAAPTSLHFDLTQKSLFAGVHVLVEKPVVEDVTQARYLMDLSRDLRLILQVGHITRFYQAVQLLKQQVKRPYLIEARRLTPNARIQDVGVILDLMIHDIDIVLSLVDSEVKDMTVAGHSLKGSVYEDVAAAQIQFENGCIARFLASRIAPNAERTFIVTEPDQTTRLDFAKEPFTEMAVYKGQKNGNGGTHVKVDVRTVHEENPLREELQHFLARIRNDAEPIGTLEDDLRSLDFATQLIAKLERTSSDKVQQIIQTR